MRLLLMMSSGTMCSKPAVAPVGDTTNGVQTTRAANCRTENDSFPDHIEVALLIQLPSRKSKNSTLDRGVESAVAELAPPRAFTTRMLPSWLASRQCLALAECILVNSIQVSRSRSNIYALLYWLATSPTWFVYVAYRYPHVTTIRGALGSCTALQGACPSLASPPNWQCIRPKAEKWT